MKMTACIYCKAGNLKPDVAQGPSQAINAVENKAEGCTCLRIRASAALQSADLGTMYKRMVGQRSTYQ